MSIDFFKCFLMSIILIGTFLIGYFTCLITNPDYLVLKNKITIYETLLNDYEKRNKQWIEWVRANLSSLDSFDDSELDEFIRLMLKSQ